VNRLAEARIPSTTMTMPRMASFLFMAQLLTAPDG
jgi:hypothetical protein